MHEFVIKKEDGNFGQGREREGGGPLYHGGFVGEIIRDLLAGYTAIVDVPASYYLEELVRVLFFSPRTGESFDMLVVA